MRNQELIKYNELNIKSNGGTELTTRSLYNFLDPEDLEGVQIITSRVRELENDKIKILHLHDLALDPENEHLRYPDKRKRFDKLVFCSNWQYQQFRDYLGVPYDTKSCVIKNGIDPIDFIPRNYKEKNKIKLIYTSTPHRGLNILVYVFDLLSKQYPNIELDVFSSFSIYGWEERDKQYEQIFEFCRNHPKINYHGTKSNDIVRKAYQESDIFAYPCIWQETSCRSLIEAMSAGCICVHPNYSALSETSSGVTLSYDGCEDIQQHAEIFYKNLKFAIDRAMTDDDNNYRKWVKSIADQNHSWTIVGNQWKNLIMSLKGI